MPSDAVTMSAAAVAYKWSRGESVICQYRGLRGRSKLFDQVCVEILTDARLESKKLTMTFMRPQTSVCARDLECCVGT